MLSPAVSRNELGIVGAVSIDEVAELLRPFVGPFEPPQSDASGYPIRRCQLSPAGKHEWIWLSPNEVPRGFVRIKDKRYEELKHLLPGTALRVPELAEVTVFVDCTDGVRELASEACMSAGLRTMLGDG
jgi:hypothetical protein